MKYILDIEASGLLQDNLDYSSMPYRLKESYRVWCIVIRNVITQEVVSLRSDLDECKRENLIAALEGCSELIGHNLVGFDLPILQLMGLLDYRVGYPGEDSTLYGKPCKITDTLLWSKLLYADRLGGHSLEAWGKRLGNNKGNFNDWSKFSEEMLEYCIQDTGVTDDALTATIKEQGKTDWSSPYAMECKLSDLTLKQELFGFAFNKDLAKKNIEELTGFMLETQAKVNPILPLKALNKGELSSYTLPKIRFKKNGEISSNLIKFIEKHSAKLDDTQENILFEGKVFPLATTNVIKEFKPATVDDIDVVKSYLLELGWVPTEVKERDLLKNTDKTVKTPEEIDASIQRYVNQTETSLFRELRLDFLGCSFSQLGSFLRNKVQGSKPVYVPTNPKLTIGLEKELCPNLISLGEKAEFVKSVVHYFTYRHRKNSIAGGISTDSEQDEEPISGFLSAVREDGRIPTPADTLGANTGRYRHKVVCNIPRVTSLYGEEMRAMFGCGKGLYQLGYDFASLEARIMGHYVLGYDQGEALAIALIAEKPNDIHSINAKKLGIDRNSAKSFSYASIYGAQPKKLAKMLGISEHEAKNLFNAYWDAVPALKELKEKLEEAWERNGKKYIRGIDGRLLSTRSKHSLINVLFQSGGAIAAKWSAVFLAQELEENNLLGNPFTDTLEMHKVWWLIHMHDEQQLGVHPALMNIVNFPSDEAAIAAKEPGCSALGHGTKGTYMAFKTQPVECIDIAIKRATVRLKLKVELGFEWNTGLSWSQCH